MKQLRAQGVRCSLSVGRKANPAENQTLAQSQSGGNNDGTLHFADPIHAQGAAKIKESPARLDSARKAVEAAGGKLHAWYLTMGKYDAVLISEFPNDETAAKFVLATGSMGNITTQTLKAFTEAEYRKIVASL